MESGSVQQIQEVGGRFVLGAVVERRTSSTVYRATDKTLGGREVCVKLFHDNPNGREDLIRSFSEEVEKLRSASHPALVPILAGGFDQGHLYIAMEYIPSRTLREIMKEQREPFALDAAINVAVELVGGLKELHEQGIYHGHIDSRAILFKGDEPRIAGFTPKAIDQIQKQSTSAGRLVAEAFYIAPEQLSSNEPVDGRADIYALALILFELVTNQRPFNATNPLQAAMQRLQEAPPPPTKFNSNISPLLEAAILKGLAKDPKTRFQNATEFLEALQAASGVSKNPFAAMAAQEQSQRMTTSTIAVSMSTDAIREMLNKQNSASTNVAPAPSHSAPPVDALATSMGMKATEMLPASLMVISGAQRGKKVSLTKPQSMIGSDDICDIVIHEKGVPLRYALVFQRGASFFVAPLSAAKVRVNGSEIKEEERELKRGDVINVGENEVRFVAPGEVFTLREDVADRVIDRPKSKTGLYLFVVALLVATLASGSFYVYQQRVDARAAALKREQQKKQAEREQIVSKLRAEGDELLKSGALVEPVGANAQEKFREILEHNPEDSYAKRRLEEIGERTGQLKEDAERRRQLASKLNELKVDGNKYFESKQYVSPPGRNAREAFLEVLKIDPNDVDAKTRIAEIDKIMSDLLGRVKELVVTAKSYKEAGQYIAPEGQNAFEVVKSILDVDPKNSDANEMLLDMAARSVYAGDLAKKRVRPDLVRKYYLTGKALGVDPAYIEERMKGLELMERSRSATVIIDTGQEKKETPKSSSSGNYLDSAEIDRRVSNLELSEKLGGPGKDRAFIDLKSRK